MELSKSEIENLHLCLDKLIDLNPREFVHGHEMSQKSRYVLSLLAKYGNILIEQDKREKCTYLSA